MKQTIPLYHTTGISGFRITGIRTVARSGKSSEIKDAKECQKAERREERLSGKGRGGRRQLIISIERRHKDIVEQRRKESITDVADDFGVSRRIVREAEIRALERKYRCVSLKGVKRIGVDEFYAFGNEKGGRQFVTIVRDLDARTDGFNNKIRRLIRQAYGCRDFRYFRLKIFDLPNLRPRDNDS